MKTYNGILHVMNEIRLTITHLSSPHRLNQTRVPTVSYHTMPKLMHDKIHHSWITSIDHFTKQSLFVIKQNVFWTFTSIIICFQKSMCLLWVTHFLWSHRKLRKPSHTFTAFHRWIYMCNQKYNGAFCLQYRDAPISGGPINNPSTRGNLWISGAPISHSHVSYIKTYSCIIFFFLQITHFL